MKRLCFLLLLFVLPFAAGCSLTGADDDESDVTPVLPRELTAAEKAVVAADNRFGFDLLRTLEEAKPGSNVFISPISVSMALGMTANGASGDTYDDMVRTLGKDHLDPTAVNESYRDLTALLTGLDPRVRVEIANAVFYRTGYPVLPAFLDAGHTYFDAEIDDVDFSAPGAVDVINGWADEKTHGLIDEVIREIRPEVVMFLMNAVYFKGRWLYQFDPDDTEDAPFTNVDGSQTTVPMMTLEGGLPVLRTDRFDAVDLPYGDSLYSMTVLVPTGDHTAGELVDDLDQETWSAWESQLTLTNVRLFLPRFQTGYKESLVDALTALGMGSAFTPAADFSRIVEGGGPYIDDVIHQAVVIVNEEGTEAAAVTTVIVIETSAGGPPEIRVDRPFVFMIRERSTGTILFIGIINSLA